MELYMHCILDYMVVLACSSFIVVVRKHVHFIIIIQQTVELTFIFIWDEKDKSLKLNSINTRRMAYTQRTPHTHTHARGSIVFRLDIDTQHVENIVYALEACSVSSMCFMCSVDGWVYLNIFDKIERIERLARDHKTWRIV